MRVNESKYIIQSISYSVALLLISGSVIQAFLLENGISETRVALYLSIVQIIQVASMLVVSVLVDRVKNVLRMCALSTVFQLALYGALILICVLKDITLTFKYTLVLSSGIFTNIIQAVYSTLSYKMPYHIIDMRRFGYLSAVVGITTGLVCSAVTAVMSYFTKNYHYNTVMLLSFIVGAISLILAYVVTEAFKDIKNKAAVKIISKKPVNLLKYKPFTVLIVPNLLRGFCTGVLSVCMTIGFSLGITDKASGATLSLLLQISVIASCFIYAFLSKKNIDGLIIALSSIFLLISMPFMFVGDIAVFYIVYFIANFFINFVNYSVPVAITNFVDYDHIGAYSSWRMLIHTLGIALSNALLTPMLSLLGPTLLFIIAGTCQFVSGISYFICIKKYRIDL